MSQKLSDKFRSFVFDESPDNGNEDVIKTLNSEIAQGNIEYQILLDDKLGKSYFYECMKLAYNVIKSFELEELEEITEEQAWKVLAGKFEWSWSGLRANVINLVKALESGLAMGEINDIASGYKVVIEKPIIPQYVAEVIKDHKEQKYDIYDSLDVIITTNGEGIPDISNWLADANNIDVYARAWLAYPNIEIEEEQKYYALIKGHELVGEYCKYFHKGISDKGENIVRVGRNIKSDPEIKMLLTKDEWTELGINDSNADFVEVEELEE